MRAHLAPLLLAFVAACGGGSTDAIDTGAAPGSSLAGRGTVTLLLADDPAEDHDKVLVTVVRVTLKPVGDGEPVVLFEDADGREFDLLALRDEDLVLAVKDIPVGTYQSIELEIGAVRTEGGPCDDLEIKVPSGRLKLMPGEPFDVAEGEAIAIRLDIDAKKSLNLHQAGNSGKCIFNPVVRVDIGTVDRPVERTCPRAITGTIARLADAAFALDLGGDRGQLKVVVNRGTAFFDDDVLAAEFVDFDIGDTVSVKGVWSDFDELTAHAVVSGTVLIVDGTASSGVTDGVFEMKPDPGEALIGATDVLLADDTVVLKGCVVSDTDAIVADARVSVTGKVSLGDGEFRAAAVVVLPGDDVAVPVDE
ncbi:MAG: DUF4382 domain-containing protein [Planctomycetota bacterium]|jgi:hypothetical protein